MDISLWFFDTGVTVYITYDRYVFKVYEEVRDKVKVLLGNKLNIFLDIWGTGVVELYISCKNKLIQLVFGVMCYFVYKLCCIRVWFVCCK